MRLLGLDIMLCDSNGNETDYVEISYELHTQIFYNINKELWGKTKYVRNLKHYYLAKGNFKGSEVEEFIQELNTLVPFLDKRYQDQLINIIKKTKHLLPYNIIIAGD